MKIVPIIVLLLGAQWSFASSNKTPADCIKAVTQALSLSSGQKLEAKAEKCELHVAYGGPGFDLSIELLTLKDLSINPNNGPDYQMITWLDAVMDAASSMNTYDISRC